MFYRQIGDGSARSETNSSQSVTDTKRYDAFGMLVASTGSNPTPFGFVGGSQYQTDADSGLMLLGHRYYDASIGRFISRDPAYAGDFPLPLFPRFARRGSEPGMQNGWFPSRQPLLRKEDIFESLAESGITAGSYKQEFNNESVAHINF